MQTHTERARESESMFARSREQERASEREGEGENFLQTGEFFVDHTRLRNDSEFLRRRAAAFLLFST